MILKIPVRPHVKKFLLARFAQPFVLTDDSYIGSYLYRLLRRQESDPNCDNCLSRYTDTFLVNVSSDKVFKAGAYVITTHTITTFNNFVDEIFKEKLYAFLDDLEMFSSELTMKQGIYDYMSKYDMLEGTDVTYDGLKKAYYRYRKHREDHKISA